MTFAGALRDALDDPHPKTSQTRVHDLVAGRLKGLAPGSSVRHTDYFNHSWIPDLVVSTPETAERQVFLRFGVDDPSFEIDIEHLSDRAPVFLDVDLEVEDESPDGEWDLKSRLAETDAQPVMVADVAAIDRLDEARRNRADFVEATKRVVTGGRGLVDADGADELADGWMSAASAISSAEVGQLRGALDTLERYLSGVAALRLETVARTRWLSAGHAADAFPGQEQWTVEGREPWEIARLAVALVDEDGDVTAQRWHEIAQATNLSDLGHELFQLRARRSGGKVNEMLDAGLSYWTAQYAYVPQLPSDSLVPFDWSFGEYSIALNLIRRIAYFTDAGRKWSRVPGATELPLARELMPLLGSRDVRSLGLVTREEKVSHQLRNTSTAPLADRVEHFLASEDTAAWQSARVTTLDVRVAGTAAVAHIDFERSVVKTDVPVPIRAYATLCGRYVAQLNDDELRELSERLAAD